MRSIAFYLIIFLGHLALNIYASATSNIYSTFTLQFYLDSEMMTVLCETLEEERIVSESFAKIIKICNIYTASSALSQVFDYRPIENLDSWFYQSILFTDFADMKSLFQYFIRMLPRKVAAKLFQLGSYGPFSLPKVQVYDCSSFFQTVNLNGGFPKRLVCHRPRQGTKVSLKTNVKGYNEFSMKEERIYQLKFVISSDDDDDEFLILKYCGNFRWKSFSIKRDNMGDGYIVQKKVTQSDAMELILSSEALCFYRPASVNTKVPPSMHQSGSNQIIPTSALPTITNQPNTRLPSRLKSDLVIALFGVLIGLLFSSFRQ